MMRKAAIAMARLKGLSSAAIPHSGVKTVKLVNREFVQAIEDHWRSRAIEWNLVKP